MNSVVNTDYITFTMNRQYRWVQPFFQLTAGNNVFQFGDANANQPRLMEGRFEYTYSDSLGLFQNQSVCLTENTIGAAVDSMSTEEWDDMPISFYWNVPPSVQWDMEEEDWTIEKLMDTTIGDHLPLCIEIEM